MNRKKTADQEVQNLELLKKYNMETVQAKSNKKEWLSIFNNNVIVRNIPFFLFLSVLAVVYIYNGHRADKLFKRITVVEKNIKELQYEYKSVQSEVIFRSKATELMRAVEPLGLKELSEKPIILNNK